MPRPACILVAEDEDADVFLLRHALKQAGLRHELIVTQDGQEAIDYLSAQADHRDRPQHPMPQLVLLDLKMPRMTGFEVLAWLRTRPELNQVPAVVLTSSDDEGDRRRAKRLGAADYLVKPSSIQGLQQMLRDLDVKWLAGPA